jgi:hypothetical protein
MLTQNFPVSWLRSTVHRPCSGVGVSAQRATAAATATTSTPIPFLAFIAILPRPVSNFVSKTARSFPVAAETLQHCGTLAMSCE